MQYLKCKISHYLTYPTSTYLLTTHLVCTGTLRIYLVTIFSEIFDVMLALSSSEIYRHSLEKNERGNAHRKKQWNSKCCIITF